MSRIRWLALSTGFFLACGGAAEETEEGTTTDTTAVVEEAPAALEETPSADTEFTPVEVPDAFPSDFPIPPQSIVTSAISQSDATGIISSITVMSETPSEDQFQWYKNALSQAGWTMASEGQSGQSRSLHAQQGESYVDLTVSPYGNGNWSQTDAVIWKAQS
jgi:hypothetical protein